MTKFLNHTRIKTVVGENGNYGKWEILGRITYYRKGLGMSTMEYASLMVELQQDAYTSKTRESHIFEGNRADRFVRLGAKHYLVVLYFPASACQSHPMYR